VRDTLTAYQNDRLGTHNQYLRYHIQYDPADKTFEYLGLNRGGVGIGTPPEHDEVYVIINHYGKVVKARWLFDTHENGRTVSLFDRAATSSKARVRELLQRWVHDDLNSEDNEHIALRLRSRRTLRQFLAAQELRRLTAGSSRRIRNAVARLCDDM